MQTKSIRLTLAADQTYSKYKWTGTVSIGLTFKCWPVWNHELVTTQKSIISQTYRHISSRLNGIHTFHPKIFIPSIVLKRKGKSYFFPHNTLAVFEFFLVIFYPSSIHSHCCLKDGRLGPLMLKTGSLIRVRSTGCSMSIYNMKQVWYHEEGRKKFSVVCYVYYGNKLFITAAMFIVQKKKQGEHPRYHFKHRKSTNLKTVLSKK